MTDTRIGPKNAFFTFDSRRSPTDMSVPPMKIAVVEILRPAREDRAVHQIAHGVFGDAAVAHDVIGAAIARDNAIEHAGMNRAVELNEELAH